MITRGGARQAARAQAQRQAVVVGQVEVESATSGCVSAIASKPSRAVAAVAATRRPSSSSTSPRSPARTAG